MISYLLVRVLVLTSMLSIMSCMIFLNVNVTPRFQEPFFEGGGRRRVEERDQLETESCTQLFNCSRRVEQTKLFS